MVKWKNSSNTTCMHNIIKSVFFQKGKTYSSNRKTIHCFNTPRANWEIQMHWENDI